MKAPSAPVVASPTPSTLIVTPPSGLLVSVSIAVPDTPFPGVGVGGGGAGVTGAVGAVGDVGVDGLEGPPQAATADSIK